MNSNHPPVVVPPDDGRSFHFFNHLATVKVGHDATTSRLNVTEFEAPSSFDRFVADLGDPIVDRAVPAPTEVDLARVAGAGAAHGIEILGPPPAALA